MLRITQAEHDALIERCLSAYLEAGTPELSLDQLAYGVGVSKRMLVHYFGNRRAIEERAIALFEQRLQSELRAEALPADLSLAAVVSQQWERLTAPESRSQLRFTLNLYRRAWNGSDRARSFYAEHRRILSELLERYTEDRSRVEAVLQLLEGAAVAFLITGDPEPGRLALERLTSGYKR